jgi:segregation and condensation protein A
MSYKVKLDVFEGPLDLLLYLIKKNEIDIYDIPIATITEQYLEYLELMRMLDLNIAGEFLVIAATLIHIKSKMLLPPDEKELFPEEEEDPREELVRRLVEYKKFKEVAGILQDLEGQRKKMFTRDIPFEAAPGEVFFEASLFDLITAFTRVLKDVPKDIFQEIIKDEFTVEQKVHDLLHRLVVTPAISLFELFKNSKNKTEIIATFLAVLELIRLKEIIVVQKQNFSDIEIIRNEKHRLSATE